MSRYCLQNTVPVHETLAVMKFNGSRRALLGPEVLPPWETMGRKLFSAVALNILDRRRGEEVQGDGGGGVHLN